MNNNSPWASAPFFRDLTARNKLAKEKGFVFCEVSGLSGLEDALSHLQNAKAFVCVSDISQGVSSMDNTPHCEKVKTIFLAMRHALNDMKARCACLETMHELFRQFMSVLMKEKTKLQQDCIYIDERINFQEIDRYFFSGCAAAYFQIKVVNYIDIQYNEAEWVLPSPNS